MNSGLSPGDPTLVAAFKSALIHQGAIAALLVAFVLLIWATARTWPYATSGTKPKTEAGAARPVGAGEARARWLLRIGFGTLWILDGILQAQPKMAAGLPTLVIAPTAASSPAWVQHLVNWGATAWSYHPIQAGAASVWIQVGIGGWLIAAARGRWSRLAGLASVAWGLTVWVFGESFGGIFAPGLSWLTGAPGAVLLYVVAGALIALPESSWRSPRAGRRLLAGLGIYFAGMAVLQAWPGRGFWPGTGHGQPGSLAGMVRSMASTPQPHVLTALLGRFASLTASNALAVNLVVVIALGALGAIFLTGQPRLARYAMWFGLALCLADWVLVQDFGILGGVGTDPNSMIPTALLVVAGYVALAHAPQETLAIEEVPAAEGMPATEGANGDGTETGHAWRGWRGLRPRAVREMVAGAPVQSMAAAAAVGVILLGAAPMASAAVNRTADPILALAIAGNSTTLDLPAPAFQLTDQDGRTVTQASLRGKVVLMTFLDPVCTTDCPIIAQELKQAGALLGAQDSRVTLVAIVANPTYRSTALVQAFDRQEGLTGVSNWRYLTGSPDQLAALWRQYGVTVQNLPAGAMTAHNDLAVVIDPAGHIRQEVSADPGPGTTSTQSSFSVLLSQYARQALGSS